MNGKIEITLSFKNGDQAIATASPGPSSAPTNKRTSILSRSTEFVQPSLSPDTIASYASATDSQVTNPVVREYASNGVPLYKMSREVVTISDLWQEWEYGRDGNWPVKELEKDWGTKWRKNDRKWFNIRLHIINAIETLKKERNFSTDSAIEALQTVSNKNNWSLDRLGTNLQKGEYNPLKETRRGKHSMPNQ